MHFPSAKQGIVCLILLSAPVFTIHTLAQNGQREQQRPADRPAPAARPAARPVQTQRPAARPAQPTRPVARPAQPTRPAVRPAQPTRPAVRPAQPTRPAARPAQPTRPAARPTQPTRPAVRPAQPTRPATRPGQTARPVNSNVRVNNGRVNNTNVNVYNVNRHVDRGGHVTVVNRPPARVYPGRYNYYYHPYRPYSWGPRWHPIGFLAAALAATAIIITINSQRYHYDQGVYYAPAPSGGGYSVVPAPIGAVVTNLPSGYSVMPVGGSNYFYYGGVFYISNGSSYTVVAPPAGAVVTELPAGAQETTLDGRKYVVYNGTYYQPFSNNGTNAYEVVAVE